jgi:hypothetical protein
MSSSNLFSAVEDASSGKLRYKNSENFVERLARVRPRFYLLFLFPDLISETQQETNGIARHSHLAPSKICIFCSRIHRGISLRTPSAN